ncbi:MAG: DUF5305 family protein [Caldilineaceae bacterium]
MVVGGAPVSEESDTLGRDVEIPHPQRTLITDVATASLGVSIILVLIWAVASQWAVRSPFSIQQLTSELHRRYGDVIVEAVSLPDSAPHQIVVHLRSLDDIGRTAHELMKPIILVMNGDERHYVVIDGADNVRYEVRIPGRLQNAALQGLRPHPTASPKPGCSKMMHCILKCSVVPKWPTSPM